jgi:DNA mismatch repair protein MLH3
VLGQIDRKFIACLFEDPCGDEGHYQRGGKQEKTLILIDQHAADERVRVERYLKELCEGVRRQAQDKGNSLERVTLKSPIPIPLSRHDAVTLAQSNEIMGDFRRWGVEFDFTKMAKEEKTEDRISDAYSEVFVLTVPTVVSEKVHSIHNYCALVRFLMTSSTAAQW